MWQNWVQGAAWPFSGFFPVGENEKIIGKGPGLARGKYLVNISLSRKRETQWYRDLNQGSANWGPHLKSSLPSVFINKVLLEHNHAHSFIYFLQLLPCYHSRVQSLWQSLPFQIFFFFWKNLLKPLTSLCSCICSALQTEGLAGGETKVDIICDELPGRTFLVQHNPEILSTLSGGVKFSFFFLIVFLILKQKSRSWQTASAIMLIKLWRGPFP